MQATAGKPQIKTRETSKSRESVFAPKVLLYVINSEVVQRMHEPLYDCYITAVGQKQLDNFILLSLQHLIQ